MEKLIEFYKIKNNIESILPIINGESQVSLRILDWFVTNYSKINKIRYEVLNDNKKYYVDVYMDYKAQLKAYNKRLFDPFCRHSRIQFKYSDCSVVITTIGQLNFFKWALKNNIINYVTEYLDNIKLDMLKNNKNRKKKNTSSETSSEENNSDKITNSDVKLIDNSSESSIEYIDIISSDEKMKDMKKDNKLILEFD